MEDQEPFKNNKYNPSNKNPIKPKFNLVDGQAVKYVRDSDQFYFGRYVTDPKTKEALQNWLSKDWLKSGRSLQDPGELKLFRQRFGDRVGKEDYKIRRVVETSVSRSKNWGNILTVEQSGGTRVEIAGPDDNRICDWCRSMLGKEYELAPVVKHIKHVMSRPPEEIPDIAPFVTNVLTPTETKAASVDDLLKLGITLPPYHPSCRHRFIVSKFDD